MSESGNIVKNVVEYIVTQIVENEDEVKVEVACLLYTSPSPRDGLLSRMPSSA